MTDTLRKRLERTKRLLHNGRDGWPDHAAAVAEAIAELDRLEAEVKKPGLPDGAVVFHPVNSDTIVISRRGHPEDDFLIDPTHALYRFFSAFLPTAGTPMKQETAEKPKPVSLVNRFKIEISHVSALTMGDPVPQLWFSWLVSRVDEELADIRRTLDQERGV